MSGLPVFHADTFELLQAVGQIVLGRGNRQCLIDGVYAFDDRDVYRARVSCDQGKTWGWQIISREELIEAMP